VPEWVISSIRIIPSSIRNFLYNLYAIAEIKEFNYT
jgi:hypothetical protein